MRELQFRVWSLLFNSGGEMIQLDATNDHFDGIDLIEEEGWTVMQFTGLHDNNGKGIFEGDILLESAPRGNKYQVVRVKGGFAINTFQDELKSPMFYESLADMQTNGYVENQCMVIGNIYENPDLVTP